MHAHFPHLVDIVNSSFSEGYFIERLKTAFVAPLLKKGNLDVNIMKNYRPVSNIQFTSKVLEKIARLTTQTCQRDHITPVLKELHWLPVSSHNKYKVLVLAYKGVHGQAPSYLSRLLKIQCRDERTQGAKEILLYQPTSKNAIGTCAFQVAAPEL